MNAGYLIHFHVKVEITLCDAPHQAMFQGGLLLHICAPFCLEVLGSVGRKPVP